MEKEINRLICELGKRCENKRYSLATAESCTGGGIAYLISKNPVCSPLLERGYVVYSNTAKEELLEVSSYTIQTYGAVSKETVIAMAEGALKHSKASISIATTGIEGSNSANENHGVLEGVVWIGCAGINRKTFTQVIKHRGDRKKFIEKAIMDAFKTLIEFVDE